MRYPKEHVENYRRNAGELENNLIDEFNDGQGEPPGVHGARQRAGNGRDAHHADRVRARGGVRRAGSRAAQHRRDAPDRRHRPRRLARAAAAAVARRALDLAHPRRAARLRRQVVEDHAPPRDQLVAFQRREDVDRQAAHGREVPRRDADDGRRRRGDVRAPDRPELPGALVLRRGALARRHDEGRRLDGQVRASTPRTASSRTCSAA